MATDNGHLRGVQYRLRSESVDDQGVLRDGAEQVPWKNSPDGRILKSDVTIAKNYLSEQQIRQLERAVTGYFDYIEDMVERGNAFTMSEFANSVNEFLSFRKYEVLPHKGLISREAAEEKAHAEYEIYNRTQPIESDFDHFLELEAEVKKGKE